MKTTLVVLAAGRGSRYGGLKQIDPVGPAGEVILDYSVHDAVKAGFQRIVFIVQQSFAAEFQDKVAARYEGLAEVALACQEQEDLPVGFSVPAEREKPWGTGHAIWAARDAVAEPFMVVNADDFYGREAFAIMAGHLQNSPSEQLAMSMVAYRLDRTLSEHGAVSRGICEVGANGQLQAVDEHVKIARQADGRITGVDSTGQTRELRDDTLVSMNCWGFTPEIFGHLEPLFGRFLGSDANLADGEFYLPNAVNDLLPVAPVSVLSSAGRWFGLTYRADRERVAADLAGLTQEGVYPSPLWTL